MRGPRGAPQLVSDQNGMPISMAMVGDSRRPGQIPRYYADLIDDAETEEIRARCGGDGRTVVRFRRRGYAVSRNHVNLGASALAAPIFTATAVTGHTYTTEPAGALTFPAGREIVKSVVRPYTAAANAVTVGSRDRRQIPRL